MTPDKTPSDALAPCPFCGAPAHGYAIEPHSHSPAVLRLVPELPDHPGSYVIEGQCACGSGLIGANEAEVVARWNTRWGSPVVAGPDDDINAMGLARYKVVPAHESMFHRFAVVAGDGQQQLYLGRETECQNMARKFAGAFLDGAFYHSRATQPTQPQAGAVPLTAEQAQDLIDLESWGPEAISLNAQLLRTIRRTEAAAASKEASMELTPERIMELSDRLLRVVGAGYVRPQDADGFARAIESEVRKQDTELIRKLVEALDEATTYTESAMWSPSMTNECKELAAKGRARLEVSPKTQGGPMSNCTICHMPIKLVPSLD